MLGKKGPTPRGFDFLARWSQGAWAESKVIETVNASSDLLAVHYGPSRGDPVSYNEFSAWKKFFEEYRLKLEARGKRPDILVFQKDLLQATREDLKLIDQLPDLDEQDSAKFVRLSSAALEVETSLWKARKALQFGKELSFTLKEEDMDRLNQWQEAHHKPLFIVQMFYDSAYIIPYSRVKQLISEGLVKKAEKDRKTGKVTYNVPLSMGLEFALLVEAPLVEPRVLENEKGLVMAYVVFNGGRFELTEQGLAVLRST